MQVRLLGGICSRRVAGHTAAPKNARPQRTSHRFYASQTKSSVDVLDELIFETDEAAKKPVMSSGTTTTTTTKTTAAASQAPGTKPSRPEAAAHKSRIHTSIKKLTPLTRLIAKMPVDLAVTQLALSREKVARIVKSTLVSCKKNAVNTKGMDASKLYVSRVVVGRATPAKRVTFAAKGRIGIVHKKVSHLSIFLAEKTDAMTLPRFPVRQSGTASSRLASSALSTPPNA
jgi:large subunit ribosomal protein L22